MLHLLVVIYPVALNSRTTTSGAGRTLSLLLRMHAVLRHIFLILTNLSLVVSPVGHVGIYVVSQSQQDFLNAVRIHVHNSLNLLLAQIKSKLLESFDIERVPIIGLLAD